MRISSQQGTISKKPRWKTVQLFFSDQKSEDETCVVFGCCLVGWDSDDMGRFFCEDRLKKQQMCDQVELPLFSYGTDGHQLYV